MYRRTSLCIFYIELVVWWSGMFACPAYSTPLSTAIVLTCGACKIGTTCSPYIPVYLRMSSNEKGAVEQFILFHFLCF